MISARLLLTLLFRCALGRCALGLWLGGCGDPVPLRPCEVGNRGPQAISHWRFGLGITPKLDLLLVVETTVAASDLRSLTARALPAALDALQFYGGLPELHVGVVASGTGTAPACTEQSNQEQRRPCGLSRGYRYLATGACGAYFLDSSIRPQEVAACLADLPAVPCDQGDPLSVLMRTLADPVAAGLDGPTPFFRPDAALAIMFVASPPPTASDEPPDRPDVPTVVRALANHLAPSQSVVVLLVVADRTCSTSPPSALRFAPFRLRSFADAFSGDAASPYCGTAVRDAFASALSFRTLDLGHICLKDVRDKAADTAGLQPECTVEERRDDAPVEEGPPHFRTVPACDEGQPPCWRLEAPETSGCGPGRSLTIVRPPGFCPQVRSTLEVRCAICTSPDDPGCAVTF